ncbi:MAG: chorismate synthase [Bacteroidia bacterium]
MNTFGTLFRITTFGESHGKGIGVVIDGCPSGLFLDMEYIQTQLDRRKPGQSRISSQRKEGDKVELLSGHVEYVSTGTPLAFLIQNEDARSKDYDNMAQLYRPSHADYTYHKKYGLRDVAGGGRASARETATRVIAGAVANLYLQKVSAIKIEAWTSSVHTLHLTEIPQNIAFETEMTRATHCPDESLANQMFTRIDEMRKAGDSVGGIITCRVKNVPVGLGEPLFDKLHAALGAAMLSIPAVKGFEIGSGFAGTEMTGSQHNDLFYAEEGRIRTHTNYSGGIQGGISNGEDIVFRVAFKPTATILKPQTTVDIEGNPAILAAKGRHDPCVVPRAVPIVEAMTALVLVDFWLRNG